MKCGVQDGTWDTIKWSSTFVRDLTDVCLYSYFSVMDDLRKQDPPGGRIEIRLDKLSFLKVRTDSCRFSFVL